MKEFQPVDFDQSHPPTFCPTWPPSELPTQLPVNCPTQLQIDCPTQLPTSFPTQLPTDCPTQKPKDGQITQSPTDLRGLETHKHALADDICYTVLPPLNSEEKPIKYVVIFVSQSSEIPINWKHDIGISVTKTGIEFEK